jgi:predicted MFS family arabinose efflux permease
VAAFLLLWNFNPFTSTVLYLYMTQFLGVSEQAYGDTVSVSAVASVAAAIAYAGYCRHVKPMQLVHWTTLLGVLSTLAFLLLEDLSSAMWVSAAFGFSSMTATLMQFDLAARFCPPAVAGTIFALLMSVCNIANALGTWLGGELYDAGAPRWGRPASYRVLITLGAITTAMCWLLIPRLKKSLGEDRSVRSTPSEG